MASFNLFRDVKYDRKDFQPKRGKKQPKTIPLKEIMTILKCSHRQAQAYQSALKLEDDCDYLLDRLANIALRLGITPTTEKKE